MSEQAPETAEAGGDALSLQPTPEQLREVLEGLLDQGLTLNSKETEYFAQNLSAVKESIPEVADLLKNSATQPPSDTNYSSRDQLLGLDIEGIRKLRDAISQYLGPKESASSEEGIWTVRSEFSRQPSVIFSETADGLESAPLSAQPSSALASPEVKGDAYYEDNRIWPSQPQHTRQELAETFQHLLDLVYSQDSSSEMTDESGRVAALQSKVALLEHELAAARKDLATAGQDLAKANAVTLARQRSFETLKTQNLELTQRLALYEQRKSQKKKMFHAQHKIVNIFWDIENVTIPKNACPTKVSYRLLEYLDREGVLSKTDSHITFRAFYRPQHTNLSFPAQRDLTRAGVELIAVASNKQEAADRIIENSINKVLLAPESDPHNTTLVLLSSDYDFVVPLEHAKIQGYRIIVVHGKGLVGNRYDGYQRRARAKMFLWDEIMKKIAEEAKVEVRRLPKAPPSPLTEEEFKPIREVILECCPDPYELHSYADLATTVLYVINTPPPLLECYTSALKQLFDVKESSNDEDAEAPSQHLLDADADETTAEPAEATKPFEYNLEYSAVKSVLYRAQLADFVSIEKTSGGESRIKRLFQLKAPLSAQASSVDDFPLIPTQSSDVYDVVVQRREAKEASKGQPTTTAHIDGTRTVHGEQLRSYTVYRIKVHTEDPALDASLPPGASHDYLIERRYTEFKDLHESCARALGLPPMPKTKLLRFSASVIRERTEVFNEHLTQCLAHYPLHPSVLTFLGKQGSFWE